jgi:serine/threonine protein kinase
LHRCYSTEADVWSIGVIAYILLCGSRPFWARTESGIFRSVLKADPSYNEAPWPALTPEAMDFVKRLLCKDPRRRMTAAQALGEFQSVCMELWIQFKLISLSIPYIMFFRSSVDQKLQ